MKTVHEAVITRRGGLATLDLCTSCPPEPGVGWVTTRAVRGHCPREGASSVWVQPPPNWEPELLPLSALLRLGLPGRGNEEPLFERAWQRNHHVSESVQPSLFPVFLDILPVAPRSTMNPLQELHGFPNATNSTRSLQRIALMSSVWTPLDRPARFLMPSLTRRCRRKKSLQKLCSTYTATESAHQTTVGLGTAVTSPVYRHDR